MKTRMGRPSRGNIDLGLAIMALSIEEGKIKPGTRLQLREIATFAGCTHQAIYFFEQRALRKLRRAAAKLRLELETEVGALR